MSEHGYNAYTSGCRCEVCRKAKADYMRGRRAAARKVAQRHTQGMGVGPGSTRKPGSTRYIAPYVTHGTRYAYEEHGCRCFPCTDARANSDRKYRQASAARSLPADDLARLYAARKEVAS